MTKISDIKFDAKDVVKLIGFLGVIVSMWVDLKADQIQGKEQRAFLQYQIDELKTQAFFLKPEDVRPVLKRK